MSIEYSSHDFERFQHLIERYLHMLDLQPWKAHSIQQQIENHAESHYSVSNRQALFKLTHRLDDPNAIPYTLEDLALHEVLHIFLGEYAYALSQCKDEYDTITLGREHSIINTLVRIINDHS